MVEAATKHALDDDFPDFECDNGDDVVAYLSNFAMLVLCPVSVLGVTPHIQNCAATDLLLVRHHALSPLALAFLSSVAALALARLTPPPPSQVPLMCCTLPLWMLFHAALRWLCCPGHWCCGGQQQPDGTMLRSAICPSMRYSSFTECVAGCCCPSRRGWYARIPAAAAVDPLRNSCC